MNRLFHGSRRKISAFDRDGIGQGAEANSALGLWLTTEPSIANEYGGGRYLMQIETGFLRLAVLRDHYSAIWGGEDLRMTDREIGWERFNDMRETLMREGYDGVWCEMPGTDLEGAICLFDPEKALVTVIHELPEETDLDILTGMLEGVAIDFEQDMEERFLSAKSQTPEP